MGSSFKQAIAEFDFEGLLSDEGFYMNRRGSGELAGICPLCQHHRESFNVDPVRGLFTCHYCGETGGPVKLIQVVKSCSYPAAVEFLLTNFSFFPNEVEDYLEEVKVPEITMPDDFYPLKTTGTQVPSFLKYAHSRGITDQMIKQYDIRYCVTGRFAWRLIVPVYHFGKLVSFVARAINTNMLKKVDTPDGNEQSKYCFNLENIWGTESVVITEGVFDALTMPDCAVATFGKRITPSQIHLLKQGRAREVTFCFDSDALPESLSFAEKHWLTFKTKVAILPDGQDPSELGEKVREYVNRAIPVDPGISLDKLKEKWYNGSR